MAPFSLTRRSAVLFLGAASLVACTPRPRARDGEEVEEGSLEWALTGPWRIDPDRDAARHPLETLRFWGLEPTMSVLEILPGRGWYTAILAPYLAAGGGRLYVAGFNPRAASVAQRETLAAFEARFLRDQETYGRIDRATVSREWQTLAPAASVDLAVLANNVHTLMAEGIAERVFAEITAALRPGAVLGVEQHRAASTGLQDPLAGSGYVQEAYVKSLAQEAGLEFVAASDVNSNPRDDRDHPFGVWTLPPTLQTAPFGQPDDPGFDTAPYEEIGESDRMTLKFRKPIAPALPSAGE